jgi:DNA-binding NtrC family response regulator
MRRLRRHEWPGNLPELRAFAARLVGHHAGGRVDEEAVQRLLAGDTERGRRRVASERDIVLDALWRHGFHRGRTAAFLGISRKTLYNKIQRYHLTGQH